jgi:hypothetical protein
MGNRDLIAVARDGAMSSMAVLGKRVRRVARQTRRYGGTVVWFFAKVLRDQPARSLLIFSSSGAGLALIAIGFAFVVAVLSSLEAGEARELLGIVVDPGESNVLFLIAAIAATTVSAGAALVFVARHQAVVAAAEVQRTIATEVTAAFGPPPLDPTMFASDQRLLNTLASLQTAEARRCALAVRRGLEIPVQVGIVMGGLVILLFLEPVAAIASMVFAAVAVPALYAANVRGVEAAKRYEALMGPSRAATRTVLEAADARHDGAFEWARSRLEGAPYVWDAIDAFRDRFVAVVRADFASQVLGAVTTFALLAYLGSAALHGRLSLVVLGTFMVLLRIALGALRSVFVSLTTVSRYYPSLYRYRLLHAGLMPASEPAPQVPALRVADETVSEPGVRLDALRPGIVVSVTAPVDASRYAAWYFAQLLAGARPEAIRAWRDRIDIALRMEDVETRRAGRDVLVASPDLIPQSGDVGPLNPTSTGVVLVVFRGKPTRTSAPLHLVAGPDGRVVAWGSPEWVRRSWPDIDELRKRLAAVYASGHDPAPAADEDDEA